MNVMNIIIIIMSISAKVAGKWKPHHKFPAVEQGSLTKSKDLLSSTSHSGVPSTAVACGSPWGNHIIRLWLRTVEEGNAWQCDGQVARLLRLHTCDELWVAPEEEKDKDTADQGYLHLPTKGC
ncbi:hypothetical protein BDBG_05458 [Blastomyces gilchristii SLH14081]|uniref:Uncharacterized protein n=1 Tax=Blastomyces gilchristii (strain SLH14081) TaxID=559298 RepID=A0A179UNR9_BLAGS|nr:uncharacterized protein BDBG_05458 [Blastomyces gilchristii SLH14081]OAT09736.1 hypothetical protein BDBG_05458 [Blastomyces gilchristii SLH14081]